MHGHHARIMYKYKREALVNSNIVLTPGCSARNKCMSTRAFEHEHEHEHMCKIEY